MQLLKVAKLKPGMIIGRSVLASAGQVLLDPGAVLTRNIIKDLAKWHLEWVAVVPPAEGFREIYAMTLAKIAAAFEQVRLFNEMPVAAFEDLVSYIELLVDASGVIGKLHRVSEYSEYTFEHSLNVAIIAGILANWLGYDNFTRKELILAGLLHDIGKALTPLEILNKPGSLTAEEMAEIREHSLKGFELVDEAPISQAVKTAILQHHERLDGSGYPAGLTNDKISSYAKIVAIADIYDAMTSQRVYRDKMTTLDAIETLATEMYGKLDPAICLTFLENIRSCLIGRTVLLTNGEKAKVVMLHGDLRLKPVVRLENGVLLDLNRISAVSISEIQEVSEEPVMPGKRLG